MQISLLRKAEQVDNFGGRVCMCVRGVCKSLSMCLCVCALFYTGINNESGSASCA